MRRVRCLFLVNRDGNLRCTFRVLVTNSGRCIQDSRSRHVRRVRCLFLVNRDGNLRCTFRVLVTNSGRCIQDSRSRRVRCLFLELTTDRGGDDALATMLGFAF